MLPTAPQLPSVPIPVVTPCVSRRGQMTPGEPPTETHCPGSGAQKQVCSGIAQRVQ